MTERPPSKTAPAGLRRSAWRRFRRKRLGMIGLAIVGLMFAAALLAPLLANDDPVVCKFDGRIYAPALIETIQVIPFAKYIVKKSPPFRWEGFSFKESFDAKRGDWAVWPLVAYGPFEIGMRPLDAPSDEHLLGTDDVGRDVLARMIHGAGVSMKVGFISMGIATLLGLVIGASAGYFGGWIDILISRFIEIVICFPTFFLILAILAWLPPRIETVMIVIGLTSWTGIARYARGEILRLRQVDYTQAARALGAGHWRIVSRHLLPNSIAPVLVSVTFGIASAILVEAGLSFLGFGVQPPEPSWGNILQDGYSNLRSAPHIIQPACIAIFFAVMAFNLVGDALRDVIDPRLSGGGD